jgi:hypothetical protein
MIKDLLRLKWHANLSHEQAAAALKISKGVVAKYVGLANAAGLDWASVQDWSEQQLATALQPRSATALPMMVPDWGRIHRELDRKGVTLMLLWQEYVAAHPEGRTWRYTQFCEHYKAFAATLKRSMRQHRRAGEKLFVDYAGSTVPLSDGARAQVFVSAMAASSYVFACALDLDPYAAPAAGPAVTIAETGGHDTETTSPTPPAGVGHDDRNDRSRSPQ